LFGPAGYGLRTGIIVAPARVTAAAAPLLFGLLLDAMGTVRWSSRLELASRHSRHWHCCACNRQ